MSHDLSDSDHFDPREYFSRPIPSHSRVDIDPEGEEYLTGEAPFTIVGDDELFQHLYKYHRGGGFSCIILTELSYLFTVLFTIIFSTFLLTCVDWTALQSGSKRKLEDAIYPSCSPPGGRSFFVSLLVFAFTTWWCIQAYRTSRYLQRLWKIRGIWIGRLGLSSDVKWVTWQNVIDRYHERIDSATDSHYIVNCIMRWDNYMIALLTKDIFEFGELSGLGGGTIFTKFVEWNITQCIKHALFRDDGILIQDVMRNASKKEYTERLRKSFIIGSVLGAIFAPFAISAVSVYLVYRYVSEYHKDPEALGLYCFTPLARWKLRDFNELDHVYMKRINGAHSKIKEYLSQFVNKELEIVMKFISFMVGSMFLTLMVFSLFNSDIIVSLWETEKPIIFYIGILGAVLVMFQNKKSEIPTEFDPCAKFDELIYLLHYTPVSWATMSSLERYHEVGKLFRYKWSIIFQEILSIVYCPLLLFFWLAPRSEKIVSFFRENSVEREKLRIICSCAEFDMYKQFIRTDRHVDETDEDVITEEENSASRELTREGGSMESRDALERFLKSKMSASVLNFREAYPTWDPRFYERRSRSHLSELRSTRTGMESTSPETTYGTPAGPFTYSSDTIQQSLPNTDFALPFPLTLETESIHVDGACYPDEPSGSPERKGVEIKFRS